MKIIILILIFFSLETLGQDKLINYKYDKEIDSLFLKFKKINLSQSGIQAYRLQIEVSLKLVFDDNHANFEDNL